VADLAATSLGGPTEIIYILMPNDNAHPLDDAHALHSVRQCLMRF